MADLLGSWGLSVTLTENGALACEQLALDRGGFDVVILDQTMPQIIAAQRGVARVQVSARAKRLILVDFDPSAISAQRILGSVRDRGVSAQLVGM
jgi:CheY-like chemotaxis protein